MIDRKVFFDKIRQRPFGGSLSASQVAGTNIILDVWEESFRQRTPITQMAVCLATTYHETGATMQPIKERGNSEYLRLNYDVTGRNPTRAKNYGNIRPGDGIKFSGKGDVQLTWYDNYLKATKRLRALGLISPDVDFTKTPEKVMEPRIAALIMFIGMEEGWFTGKTLDQLVDPNVDGDEHADAVRSRTIINGTDRAEKIAGHADDFLAALIAADTPGTKAPLAPPPPDIPKPEPKPPAVAKTGSNVGGLIGGAVVTGSTVVIAKQTSAQGASTSQIALVVGCGVVIALAVFFVIRHWRKP